MKAYGDPATATIAIAESRRTSVDAALAALGGVGVATPGDSSRLQAIADHVAAAGTASTDAAVLDERLRALLGDIGTLERSGWTGALEARAAVASVVTFVEYDRYRAGGE
jgi:hypothetical protein